MIPGVTDPGSGISPSIFGTVLAALFAGGTGVFAFLVGMIRNLLRENKHLYETVMDKVVPAMTENTTASKAMIEATVSLQNAIAIADDRRQRGRS